jgi:hypothetical protein
MTKVLEHFLPNVDLNLQSLKEVVRSIGSASAGQALGLNEADSITVGSSQQIQPKGDRATNAGSSVTIEEIDELHGELGWLRVDSKGTLRKLTASPPPDMKRLDDHD